MRLRSRFAGISLLIVVIAGCSHGTVSALPTAPSVVLRKLTVTPVGGGTMTAGNTVDITPSGPLSSSAPALGAYAQYSDGSGKYIEATWTTSDANVAIVSDAVLKAVGRGTATLTATALGQTASESFTVEPNVAGTWSGTYVIDTCDAGSGSMFEAVCGNTPGRARGIFPVGTAAPVTFQLAKSGNDLSAVTAFGDLRGTITGTDRGANFVTLLGNLTGNRTTVTLVHWDSRAKIDLMEGFIGFEVRIDGVPSHAAVTAHFDNLTRR